MNNGSRATQEEESIPYPTIPRTRAIVRNGVAERRTVAREEEEEDVNPLVSSTQTSQTRSQKILFL